MSGLRITGGRPLAPADPVAKPQVKAKAPGTAQTTAPEERMVDRESFIASVVASRQPPRMPLQGMLPQSPVATATVFARDLDAFGDRTTEDVAGTLAATYLNHAATAAQSGDPELVQAFAALGELMRSYEHIRLLKTGELG